MPETLEFNSDLDIHDNLIQLHPRLRDETYYNEVKYIVSEAPLKESFPNPQEFYVAKRLLFWGTHAALTDGYFDRASQFQNIDQSFFSTMKVRMETTYFGQYKNRFYTIAKNRNLSHQ